MSLIQRILSTTAPSSAILIRLMVGLTFLSEGIQKFLYPADLGVGRFEKIGLPSPQLLAPFVGTFEIVCGSLVVVGFLTRFAAVPLLIVILTAISTTKIPMLFDKGFWSMAHAARTDFAMLMGSLFLLIVGGGRASLDKYINRNVHQSEIQSSPQ
jgi:uncharacterized membrane protein YphA (DoxX/SURF4 family)